MREIADNIFQTGFENEHGVGWCYVLVGDTGLIVVDPGFGWHFRPNNETTYSFSELEYRSNGLITQNFLDLILFSKSVKKSLNFGILTHSHSDHASNMEFMMQKSNKINNYFEYDIINLKLIVHRNSSFNQNIFLRVKDEHELSLDGHKMLLIPTPGHSQLADDMSIYLLEQQILFCGDLCQPQGREYHISSGPSPIPYFVHGDDTRRSLQKLMKFDFKMLYTAHGYQYNRSEGMKALELTYSLLERIDLLAEKLSRENPDERKDTIALWIYDTIAHERKFDRGKAEFRKYHYDKNGISDFQKFDKVTIDYFVDKYLKNNHDALNGSAF